MKYNKEYVCNNIVSTCKSYETEIEFINDRLASGYYAFNPSALNALRSRKGKLSRRIYTVTILELKRCNK